MDIYAYAMQLERDGERYYRELAGKVNNTGLRTILTMLADAEVRHYRIFESMKENEPVVVPDTPLLSDIKNIFVRMGEEKQSVVSDGSEIDLYKKAQEIEEVTRTFYLEKAGEAQEPSEKEILVRIADEEKKHYFILENIIDFVGRPFNWLENAEWYHLEEY